MKRQEFLEIFKDSKYFQYLDQFRGRKEISGLDIHHIYPRSFEEGKIDEEDNLVLLTRVEHLKAHLLLVLSMEELGRFGRSYRKAIKAVNFLFQLHWESLNFQEKQNLADNVELLEILCQKALHDPRPEDVCLKIRKAWTPERRQQQSERMSRFNRERETAPMQGKFQSEETRKAISEALKKHKRTQEHCKHISEAKMGSHHVPHSDLTKSRMSETAKGRITVWKNGIKAYCRAETLQEFLNSGYFLSKKDSL